MAKFSQISCWIGLEEEEEDVDVECGWLWYIYIIFLDMQAA